MANFTLKLLVPNNDLDKNVVISRDIEEHFLSTLITSFNSQLDEYNDNKNQLKKYNEGNNQGSLFPSHSISYTYNEKFSKHKNGQKELTFDLDDKYLTDSAWELNPYARVLHVGTLLELTDKYKNVYLFIITKVTPTFTNLNIKYSYTCQDLFTYQLSRQNSGYNLTNDETSSSFIGALTLDDWAQMITKECYINYTYVPLDSGVIMTDTGTIKQYKGTLNLNNVYKVLKKEYTATSNPELFETIPFSVSGSSAAAALISLADSFGVQLRVVEGYNSDFPNNDVYNYFFWFEPLKNEDVSGLMYSPKREVQNFGMSFSGDALTTVLNVNSTTWNDEEIGLFPSVPSFFINFFASSSWDSSKYEPGFFERLVQGEYRTNLELDTVAADFITIDNGVASIKIKISNWKPYYNKIQFVWDDQHFLALNINDDPLYTPFNTVFKIKIVNGEEERTYIAGDEIDPSLLEGTPKFYLVFNCSAAEIGISIAQNYYILTRNYTQEEVEFAHIADKLPWLENKLIDFSYFLKQGIISRNEYEAIQNELTNTVRIINGKLMCYSSAHFRAIHEQVKTLAGIQAAVDALGAAFDSEIVQSYAQTGKTINNFGEYQNAYQSFFNINTKEKQPLYELNNNISSLFNKYFQAEQRVLRNLYEFRRFFEERNAFASNNEAIMEEVTYTINASGGSNIVKDNFNQKFYLYTFNDELHFDLLSSSNINSISNNNEPLVDFYKYSNGVYKKVIIPSKNLLSKQDGSVWVPVIYQNSILTSENIEHLSTAYSEDFNYYMTISEYNSTFGNIPLDRTFIIDNIEYVLLTLFELKQIHIKTQLESGSLRYYIRDEKYYISYRNNIWTTLEDISNPSRKGIKGAFKNYMLPLPNKLNGFIKNLKEKLFKDLDETTWNFYKACLPLDNIFVKDYNLTMVDDNFKILDENGIEYKYENNHFYKYNKQNKDYDYSTPISSASLYKTYYTIPFITINSSVNSLLFTLDDATITSGGVWTLLNSFISQVKSATEKYYSCTVDNTALAWSTAGAVVGLPLIGIPLAIYLNTKGRKNFASWTQEDRTDYSVTYWTGAEWKQNENSSSGSKCSKNTIITNVSDAIYKGDNFIPNYLKTASSDNAITALTDKLRETDFFSQLTRGWKHYYNYYSHIAATYSTEMYDTNNDFLVLSRNASVVRYNEELNPNETYYWVEYKVKNGSSIEEVLDLSKVFSIPATGSIYTTTFNATKWYPLITNREEINFKELFTKEELLNNISISALCQRINEKKPDGTPTAEYSSAYPVQGSDTGRIAVIAFDDNEYFLIHDEPYEKRNIVNNIPVNSQIRWQDIDTVKIYNSSTHRVLNTTDLIIPLTIKRQAKKDMYLRKATEKDWTVSQPYIEFTTGSEYLDTGVIPQADTRIEMEFEYVGSSADAWIALFGSRTYTNSEETPFYCLFWNVNGTNNQYRVSPNYREYDPGTSSNYFISKNTRYKLRMDQSGIIINNRKTSFDFTGYTNWPETATQSIYLGAINTFRNGSAYNDNRNIQIKIYSCKIYQGSTLVRSYTPYQDGSTKGLYDSVNETVITSPVGVIDYATADVDDIHWYNQNKERIYSIPQIKEQNLYSNYSFLAGSTYKTIEFYDSPLAKKHFSPTINRFTCHYDKDSSLITDEVIVTKDFSGDDELICSHDETIMEAAYGSTILEINRITDHQYDIGQMSNGAFWYFFHNRLDLPDLMQQSAIIETKLTENWSIAYNASLYSRWFIPRTWQLYDEGASNYFSNMLWVINGDKVQLSTVIIPEIKILSSNIKGQKDTTLLNNYNLIYIKSADISSVNEECITIDKSDLNDNPAFLDTYKQIFGDEPVNQNFVVQPYGKRTYYYVDYGGMTRMQTANKLTGGAAPSELFDGLYGMQLYKLLKSYTYLKDSFYTKYLNKKIAFWRQLYRRYPGIFLENTYSNNDARTSEQLYQMAELAMRDYTSPETQYNITTIDVLSLEGYEGQDLNIGDSILLNASDYYTDVDETFRALNQYLFITDISYSLRQDTDIALTVNSIKYQDKLIQSLVKLIR